MKIKTKNNMLSICFEINITLQIKGLITKRIADKKEYFLDKYPEEIK